MSLYLGAWGAMFLAQAAVACLAWHIVAHGLRFTHEGSISVSGSYDDTKRQVMVDVIDTGGLVVFCRVGRVLLWVGCFYVTGWWFGVWNNC
jgi:hypothetical protein